MKSITESYKDFKKGVISKDQFVSLARRSFPNYVTSYNSFDDAVSILKQRGLLVEEAKESSSKKKTSYKAPEKTQDSYSLESLERGIRTELEDMGYIVMQNISSEDYEKAKSKALSNLKKNCNFYLGYEKDSKTDMVPYALSKNTDTLNAMEKVKLKEHVKSIVRNILKEGK